MATAPKAPVLASVIDVFCGAGGLSYGFKSQGFEVAAGIDIDEGCRFAYETNIGAPFLRKDVLALP
jgi:DNA (cytosine-5)-methyltransferase 1